MVWDEIRRILTGAEEASKQPDEAKKVAGKQDEEIGEELGTTLQPGVLTLPGGVRVEPGQIRQGQAFTVTYQGLLAQRGAAGIILHCGYGPGAWTGLKDISMQPRGFQVWQATVLPEKTGEFSFCFRDTGGNWDNNYGRNWSTQIYPGTGWA